MKSVSELDTGVEITKWQLRDESVPPIKEATRMEKAESYVVDSVVVGVFCDLSCRVSKALASASEDASPADRVAIIEHLAVRPNRGALQGDVSCHISRGETDHDFTT